MSITRRTLVAGTAAVAAAAFAPRITVAQTAAGPFKLDPLPYPTNACNPTSAKTWKFIMTATQAYVTG